MSNEELQNKFIELIQLAQESRIDISGEMGRLQKKIRSSTQTENAWKHVELARHVERPYSLDYINRIFSDFTELHGDRAFGDDPAIVGGLAFFDHQPVTIIGHQKGRTLEQRVLRNGGMANPEGYRKAMRLAKEAEKFKRPVITFVDTPGAYPGLGAEERGIGESIARNLREWSRLKTPVICIIIGEGGSGGALGICVGDRVYMLENSVYSVISPEGCASILLRDSSRAKDAAAMLRISSEDLMAFKVIDGIIKEPSGGAHSDPDATAATIKEILAKDIPALMRCGSEELVRARKKKISAIGHYSD